MGACVCGTAVRRPRTIAESCSILPAMGSAGAGGGYAFGDVLDGAADLPVVHRAPRHGALAPRGLWPPAGSSAAAVRAGPDGLLLAASLLLARLPSALISARVRRHGGGRSRVPGGWLGRLDDGGVQAGSGLVRAGDGDGGESGCQQQVTVLRLGEGAAEAASQLLGLG